jgi:hypothetical protein
VATEATLQMIDKSTQWKDPPLGAALCRFLRDLAAFAGRRGIVAVVLVGLGAILEALSLVLIVPLLSITIGSDVSDRMGHLVTAAFGIFGVEHPGGRLALLLTAFSFVIIVRAFVLSIRDVRVAALQTSFVEAQRLRIAEYLVGAQRIKSCGCNTHALRIS